MRIRWRGLELPTRVVNDQDVSNPTYGKFSVEPFERGFGTTVGNALRRILLSSLQGAAVTSIKIKGADHEFMSMPGVMEDVTDVVLNVKQLVVKSHADTPKTMRIHSEVKGVVTAEMIEADPAIEIINPELVIANLTDDVKFDMELTVQGGRGYIPAEQMYDPDADQELGRIYIDASYSPVTRVRYRTEDTRVGQRTNYDRLLLEIWTNGTITPEMALVEAAKIFRKHLNPFVQYFELGEQVVEAAPGEDHEEIDSELLRKLSMSVHELELGVRSNNCLEAGNIQTVGQLANCPETELLQIRSFGKTSLREVKRKLQDLGLSLGMNLPLPEVKGEQDEQMTE
ncbi:MAG: DNA-directed RNA polymerase subunit alpha [Phycisphaerales bacterium]|jgi:DNA-directed RNA polymerase subunit alpha|nr:DNA-directed RNA polymerase subunit alpha [Phycisphaerales bacterium]